MNRLRKLRKQKGLTLMKVADETGLSETKLHRYETEKCEPKKETWLKLADYYDVPVAYLMGLPDGLIEYVNNLGGITYEALQDEIITWLMREIS